MTRRMLNKNYNLNKRQMALEIDEAVPTFRKRKQPKSSKDYPVIVQWAWTFGRKKEDDYQWSTYKKYKTFELAMQALQTYFRKHQGITCMLFRLNKKIYSKLEDCK